MNSECAFCGMEISNEDEDLITSLTTSTCSSKFFDENWWRLVERFNQCPCRWREHYSIIFNELADQQTKIWQKNIWDHVNEDAKEDAKEFFYHLVARMYVGRESKPWHFMTPQNREEYDESNGIQNFMELMKSQ